MQDDFWANVQVEGSTENTDEQETDTPASPPEETKPAETAPSSQGAEDTSNTENDSNVPWHKDPRWQEWQNDKQELESLRSWKDEVSPFLSELKQKGQSTSDAPPSWFGGDQDAWQQYQDHQRQVAESIKTQTLAQIKAEQEKQQKATTEAQRYLDSEFSQLRSEGKKFNENELVKTLNDYPVVTSDGKWDVRKAYEILEFQKKASENPEKAQERKRIAAAATEGSTGETPPRPYFTPDDLRGGWR